MLLNKPIKDLSCYDKQEGFSLRKLIILLLALSGTTLLEAKPLQNQTVDTIKKDETRLIGIMNYERKTRGLKPLVHWEALSSIARQHSQNMASGLYPFGHHGFDARAQEIQKVSKCYSIGENVAACYLIKDPLEKAKELWMNSPGHRDNVLGDYHETGIGIAYDKDGRCFMTQMFSKRKSKLK